MRISTAQIHNGALNSILNQQSRLIETQNQLSTGKRINAPSDDPSGATSILELGQAVSSTEQLQRNADKARGRLSAEEVALNGVVNAMQRARELTVRGNNDSIGAEGRAGIASEVRELLGGVMSLANTRDANGEYLFAGFQTGNTPFSQSGASFNYAGDQGQRHVQIGSTRQIAVGDSGYDVFMSIPGTSTNAFQVLQDLADEMDADNPDPARLDEIDAVMENVLNVQAKIGSRLSALDEQQDINEARILQYKSLKSEIEDLDFAEAVSRLQLQMTSLESAQRSYTRIQGLSLFNFI